MILKILFYIFLQQTVCSFCFHIRMKSIVLEPKFSEHVNPEVSEVPFLEWNFKNSVVVKPMKCFSLFSRDMPSFSIAMTGTLIHALGLPVKSLKETYWKVEKNFLEIIFCRRILRALPLLRSSQNWFILIFLWITRLI